MRNLTIAAREVAIVKLWAYDRRVRFLCALGLAFVASLLVAESAMACSCAPVPPRDKLRQADGAVVARLLEVRPVRETGSSADPTDFVFRTGRVIKGRARFQRGRRLVVRSVRSDASCGLSASVGELTGLFLTRADGRWTSGSCLEIPARQMRRLGQPGAGAPAGGACGA